MTVYGDWLYGQCIGWRGEWRFAEIRWTDCSSEIFNYGGELYCDSSWRPERRRERDSSCRPAAGPIPAAPRPFDGYVLSAECRTQRGGWRSSAIDVRYCPYPIENDNGGLSCGRVRPSSLPALGSMAAGT